MVFWLFGVFVFWLEVRSKFKGLAFGFVRLGRRSALLQGALIGRAAERPYRGHWITGDSLIGRAAERPPTGGVDGFLWEAALPADGWSGPGCASLTRATKASRHFDQISVIFWNLAVFSGVSSRIWPSFSTQEWDFRVVAVPLMPIFRVLAWPARFSQFDRVMERARQWQPGILEPIRRMAMARRCQSLGSYFRCPALPGRRLAQPAAHSGDAGDGQQGPDDEQAGCGDAQVAPFRPGQALHDLALAGAGVCNARPAALPAGPALRVWTGVERLPPFRWICIIAPAKSPGP